MCKPQVSSSLSLSENVLGMSFLCCMGNGTGALRSGEMDSQNPQPSVWPSQLAHISSGPSHSPAGHTWASLEPAPAQPAPEGPRSRARSFIPDGLWTLRVALPGQSLETHKSLASSNRPVPPGHKVVPHLERFLHLVSLSF